MSRWIAFGTLGRPHGVRGEVTLWPYNSLSDNAALLKEVIITSDDLSFKDGAGYLVQNCRKIAGSHYALCLAGCTSRESAALLTGKCLWADLDALKPCGENEFYLNDIMGFLVKDCTSDINIGSIIAIADYPQGPYLVVAMEEKKRQLEIPWRVEYLVDIIAENRQVILALPNGFTDFC